MNKLFPFVAIGVIAALLAGCGSGSGPRFSELFDDSAAAEGTGLQFSGLVRAVVILAKHDATQRQRAVAEQNGRRAVAKLSARVATRERVPVSSAISKTKAHPKQSAPATAATKAAHQPSSGANAQPKQESASIPEPTPKSKPAQKLPHIIAVATEKDEHTDKKAAKAVMLFDTHAEKIIGNQVYDIESEPRTGQEVRFETYSTSYIGASL